MQVRPSPCNGLRYNRITGGDRGKTTGGEVYVCDISADKLACAKVLDISNGILNTLSENLHRAVFDVTNGDGFDVCIEAAGVPEAFATCIDMAAFQGRVVDVGVSKRNADFRYTEIQRIFDGLREITLASVAFRLVLSTLCGGIVGIEREFKRRSAGFRTHILICLGAAMTTLISEYWLVYMRYYLDATRLGAGVVAGMGFIGAGTIIVTRRQRVKGLTTAAGLWTVAIVGLAVGAGFYEGGLLTTGLILLAELLF